jgi:hypothetical protein
MNPVDDLTVLDPERPVGALHASAVAAIKNRGRRRRTFRRLAVAAPSIAAAVVAVVIGFAIQGGGVTGQSEVIPASPTMTTDGTSPSTATSPTSPSTSSPPPSSTATAQDLVVPSAVRTQLLAAYESYRNMSPDQLEGFTPDELYYAHVTPGDSDWALGTVQPARSASQQTLVNLQDGESTAVFHRNGRGPWQVSVVGIPGICPGFIPDDVLARWMLQVNAYCRSQPFTAHLREGSGRGVVASGVYVTPHGSTLVPWATNGGEVDWTVTAGETPFVVRTADYRSAYTGQPTLRSCETNSPHSEGHVVAPGATYSFVVLCTVHDRPNGAFFTSYAPAGQPLAMWTGST